MTSKATRSELCTCTAIYSIVLLAGFPKIDPNKKLDWWGDITGAERGRRPRMEPATKGDKDSRECGKRQKEVDVMVEQSMVAVL